MQSLEVGKDLTCLELERGQCGDSGASYGLRVGDGVRAHRALQAIVKSLVFALSMMGNYWEVSSGKMRRSFACQGPWGSQRGSCPRHLDKRRWTFVSFPHT